MKKIISFILIFVIIFTVFNMSIYYNVVASETSKNFNSTEITDDGTKISLSKTEYIVYFYGKPIDLKDFTMKIKLNAPKAEHWGKFRIILGYNGVGSVHKQIIFSTRRRDYFDVGAAFFGVIDRPTVSPGTIEIPYNLIKNDITIKGKLIDDKTYSLDFNNGEYVYEYKVSENVSLTKDISNKCYLGFGGIVTIVDSELFNKGQYNIVVKEIDGVVMNKKDYIDISHFEYFTNDTTDDEITSENSSTNSNVTESTSSATTDEGNEKVATDNSNKTGKNNKPNKENISQNSNIILIVIGILLFASYAAIVVVILIKKKLTKASVQGEK